MFKFLQSLPSQCRPKEVALLEMDSIGCNMNELEPKARSNSFPGRQDSPVTWTLAWCLGQLVFPPRFTTNPLCALSELLDPNQSSLASLFSDSHWLDKSHGSSLLQRDVARI